MKYLCIHCHFYQPPRENPWLEQIELQDSAYPYHDWNERITAECYAPNLAARILDGHQCITRIVNNYSKISFNFGPTLLSWAAEHAREMYRGILEADKRSVKQFSGHGSAIAQAYNHIIMPLANRRDKETQIRWGIADFKSRFGRLPEGMWLSETAVDAETLEIMAEEGLAFTILAPHQAKAIRPLKGSDSWQDVTGGKIDPTRAYLFRTAKGKTINLFFYDGPISQAVAFEKLLENGEKFAGRLLSGLPASTSEAKLAHIATDGETYGHHHRHGEMALAYALNHIENKKLARVTNYGEFLSLAPPGWEVQIYERTAWSCVHGVERWRSNCGCNSGRAGWHQLWRQPLREALDWLRDWTTPHFEALGIQLLHDPWAARDAYISVVLDRSPQVREEFGKKHFVRKLTEEEQKRVWKLMELGRNAMLMYTSCGWFFDDLSGIETVQVIQYAGRVVQLAAQLFGEDVEAEFLSRLAHSHSNLADHGSGADIYRRHVKPSIVDLEKVGAHYAMSSLFAPYGDCTDVFAYEVRRLDHHAREAGKLRMALGNARFTSKVTEESEVLTFWVVHFGDHNVAGGVRRFEDAQGYKELLDSISDAFSRVDIPEVVRLLDKRFGEKTFSLRSLFRDEQRRILRLILSSTAAEAETAYLQIYEHHAALMRFLASLGTPMPREFTAAVEYAINTLLRRALAAEALDAQRVKTLLHEADANHITLDKTTLEFQLRHKLETLARHLRQEPADLDRVNALRRALEIARTLPFAVNLWAVQNEVYALQGTTHNRMKRGLSRNDKKAHEWTEGFSALKELLSIRA